MIPVAEKNMTQNSLIDYLDDDNLKGFRLHRLEVFNWGTFNQRLWTINPHGFNSLLTGDIGSGKSTLIDAIITLLVPPQKIKYNQAAGARKKERTLKSYVLGSHKNDMDEYNNSRPVNLRDGSDYSVILCYFYNKGLNKKMTLAQVFSVNNNVVNKLYVTAEDELTIKDHFSLKKDESDIITMKKRINSLPNTTVFDSYREYGISFQQYFGIKSDKVLELFFQTVSVKSIDKLTYFMRNHMLEEINFQDKIKEMLDHYNALTKAFDSIKRAKEKISLLEPMMDVIKKFENTTNEIKELKECQKYLPYYFAEKKYEIFNQHIEDAKIILTELETKIKKKDAEINELRYEETRLNIAISSDKTGQRIQLLHDKIKTLNENKEEKVRKQEKYFEQCTILNITPPRDENTFNDIKNAAQDLLKDVEAELEDSDVIADISSSKKMFDIEFNNLEEELRSLKSRNTQLPSKILEIRTEIIKNCSLERIELPFVGELIKVKSNESEWEGSLERLLHNFGLSLIVPEKYY